MVIALHELSGRREARTTDPAAHPSRSTQHAQARSEQSFVALTELSVLELSRHIAADRHLYQTVDWRRAFKDRTKDLEVALLIREKAQCESDGHAPFRATLLALGTSARMREVFHSSKLFFDIK